MNKLMVCLAFTLLSVTTVVAADSPERPAAPTSQVTSPTPEKAASGATRVDLPASQGTVHFPHRKHQEMLKDCSNCHTNGPGKIAGLGKAWAHSTCRGCHNETAKAPVQCKGCHKKDE